MTLQNRKYNFTANIKNVETAMGYFYFAILFTAIDIVYCLFAGMNLYTNVYFKAVMTLFYSLVFGVWLVIVPAMILYHEKTQNTGDKHAN
jgi:hypothetical protein